MSQMPQKQPQPVTEPESKVVGQPSSAAPAASAADPPLHPAKEPGRPFLSVDIDGTATHFATQEEAAAKITELQAAATKGGEAAKELTRVQDELGTAYQAAQGNREAMRKLYRNGGASEAEIDAMFVKMDAFREFDASGNEVDPADPAEPNQPSEVEVPVPSRPAEKARLADLHPDDQKFLASLHRRAEASDKVVMGMNNNSITDRLAGDTNGVGPYWENMDVEQRAQVVGVAREAVAEKLKNGELLEDQDLVLVVNKARDFTTKMWKDPKTVSGRQSAPRIVGREVASPTGMYLEEELDDVKSDKPMVFDGSPDDDRQIEKQLEVVRRRLVKAGV